MTNVRTQVCRTCQVEKPLEAFRADPRCKLGYRFVCKQCSRKKPGRPAPRRATKVATKAESQARIHAIKRLITRHQAEFAILVQQEKRARGLPVQKQWMSLSDMSEPESAWEQTSPSGRMMEEVPAPA